MATHFKASFEGEPLKWNKVLNLPDHIILSPAARFCRGHGVKIVTVMLLHALEGIAPVEEINGLVDSSLD